MKAKKTDKLKAIALATYLKARGHNLRRVYGWISLISLPVTRGNDARL